MKKESATEKFSATTEENSLVHKDRMKRIKQFVPFEYDSKELY